MNVQRFVDDWRLEAGEALGQEGGRQHVKIAGVNDILFGQRLPLSSRSARTRKDRSDPLDVGRVVRATEIDVFPIDVNAVLTPHHEAGNVESIVAETLHAAPYGGVGSVMAKKGDPRHGAPACKRQAPPEG